MTTIAPHFVIGVTVDSREVQGRLKRLAAQLADRTNVNKALSFKMWALVMKNFQEQSHEGEPWEPLAPSTIARRSNKKGNREIMILQDTTKMKQSFKPFSDNDLAGVGTINSMEHADLSEIHEEGLGNVPTRPMLPSRGFALSEAIKIYTYFVMRAKNK